MRNNRKISFYKRLTALLLCAALTVLAILMTSCNNSDEKDDKGTDKVTDVPTDKAVGDVTDNSPENEAYRVTVKAVRAAKNIEAGALISADALEVIELRDIDCPINAIDTVEEVTGKYARTPIYAGDFIFPAKLSATEIEEDDGVIKNDNNGIAYTLISDYAELANGKDYTEAIKTAIEKNPGATIYFPDGEYIVTEPIVIPADNEKSVSLRLESYAVIKADDKWADKNAAVIRLGVGEDSGEITDIRNVALTGGVIDANGLATGVSIEGSKDIFLSNLSIKNAFCGIHIAEGNNPSDAIGADVESIIITGNGAPESVGIRVEGTNNNFANIRISGVYWGVHCAAYASNNVFRSIHAIATGEIAKADKQVAVGFVDASNGNRYDMCVSEQFAIGFGMFTSYASVYNGCQVTWNNAENGEHIGFYSDGSFNALVTSCTVTDATGATSAYIYVEKDGGSGAVRYPINQVEDTTYDAVLQKYCATDILK